MDSSQLFLSDEKECPVSDISTAPNIQAPIFAEFVIIARPYISVLCSNEFSVEDFPSLCQEEMDESDLWSVEAVDGGDMEACKGCPLPMVCESLIARTSWKVVFAAVVILVFLAVWSFSYSNV